MSTGPSHQTVQSFEIKSAQLPLVALLPKSGLWAVVVADLLAQYGATGKNPDFFDYDPVILDFSALPQPGAFTDIHTLFQALRQSRLVPVAFRGEPPNWTAALLQAGLAPAPPDMAKSKAVTTPLPAASTLPHPLPTPTNVPVVREVLGGATTMLIDRPVRSGQKVYAKGADLVVLAMVNQGAELVADGNIHVYAPLRGKAIAGARGNAAARIFSLCLEPELISIAGVYRTGEQPLAADVVGQPAQVWLHSENGQDRLVIQALNN
ncbi:MAG: septum site-determining protein MinC [Rhodoferax sp.]|nr:septum site-determining protein MinC [Rhodoferax sp.]